MGKSSVKTDSPVLQAPTIPASQEAAPAPRAEDVKATTSVSFQALPEMELSAIVPPQSSQQPLRLYPQNDGDDGGNAVEVVLHPTGNQPAPGVHVFVAVTTSRHSLPVSQFSLRCGVDKVRSLIILLY